MRARVRAVYLLASGDEGGGVQTVYAEHLSLGVGGSFLTDGQIGVLSVSPHFFDTGGSACVYICMHTRTHTAHGVLDVSTGFRARHLEGPLLFSFKIFFLPKKQSKK